MEEVLALPAGEDTSHAGLAWHEGKASVYLAKVRFPETGKP
jgi:hypothetical protein